MEIIGSKWKCGQPCGKGNTEGLAEIFFQEKEPPPFGLLLVTIL